MPVDSPTVPNAEKASNSTRTNVTSLSSIITSVPTTMAFMAMNVIENACRTASTGMRRPNTTVSGTPRVSGDDEQEQHEHGRQLDAAGRRAGPAPTNISIICVSQVSSRICE